MLQAIVKKGKVVCEEVPAPVVRDGHLLIKVVNSCISAGTEVGGVQQSGENIIKRALKQPENVKKVVESIKSEGLVKALDKTRRKLNDGSPTGYSISGIIVGVGKGILNYQVGDRVAAAGSGIANHAEFVDVPEKLAVKIPTELSFEKASTVTLGSIAMHGIRRADLKFGEFGVVFGTGILGLLSVQYLFKAGIRVAAIDLDNDRLKLAKEYGAEIAINPSNNNLLHEVNNWTGGYGADAVLFTAATSDNEPLSKSFQMCKKKGKVVLVGVSGMTINRGDIYNKELDFQISTSYGPGRYDNEYEQQGKDYPYAYVRWTENRNMQEYLRLVDIGKIKLDKLINRIFPIKDVSEAFESFKEANDKPLMVLLDYGGTENDMGKYISSPRSISVSGHLANSNTICTALIGAGGFATGMHLPNLIKLTKKYNIHAIADINGVIAKNTAKAFRAKYATTNVDEILNDNQVDLVIIATNHKSHGELVLKTLQAGKHVFVEKPLTIDHYNLSKIKAFYQNGLENKPILFVGYNRRFSKYLKEIKNAIKSRYSPLFIHYRMNAGYLPLDHWIHTEGGRIIGEACHIIDLMTYLTDSKIVSVSYESIAPNTDKFSGNDNKSIILKYSDGSVCNIQYFSLGNDKISKEYMEIHFDNKTIIMDDYKSLKGLGIKLKELISRKSEKGHFEELLELYSSLRNSKNWPIEFWDLIQTSEASFLMK